MFKSLPEKGPYVFPSVRSKELSLKKGVSVLWWGRIRKRAGLPDVTIHDLRRTCESNLPIRGENLAVIARVLNQYKLSQHGDLRTPEFSAGPISPL
jgi:integrase